MTWQIVVLAVLVLLPLLLLTAFHPGRERLSARGRPLEREWPRQPQHDGAAGDEHH
ncbi:MAG: hypothetical protein ACLFRD_04400 [Nitriliruptoraceae bacterium]